MLLNVDLISKKKERFNKMKLSLGFIIEDKTLNDLIKNHEDSKEKHMRDLCNFLKESNIIQEFKKNTKGLILLKFAIIGLFKSGFNKKEILKILKKLFEIEISKNQLSPGNDKIH